MKSTELRIGNWYNFSEVGCNDPHKITAKDILELDQDPIDDIYYPIPLTEEILLKCGFTKMTDTTPYNYRIFKSKMVFYIRYGDFTTDRGKTMIQGFNGLFVGNKFIRVIRYVHEVQNLVQCLTGEELNIEL